MGLSPYQGSGSNRNASLHFLPVSALARFALSKLANDG